MRIRELINDEKRRLTRVIEVNKSRLDELELKELSKWGYRSKGMCESSIYEAECSLDFITELEDLLYK